MSAVAKVAALKVAKGDRFDVFGADGAIAFGTGAIDGVMNVVGAGAASKVVGPLFKTVAVDAAEQVATTGFKSVGRELLTKAVEGSLTSTGSAVFESAANENTWKNGFINGMGKLAVTSATSIATGAVVAPGMHYGIKGVSAIGEKISGASSKGLEQSLEHEAAQAGEVAAGKTPRESASGMPSETVSAAEPALGTEGSAEAGGFAAPPSEIGSPANIPEHVGAPGPDQLHGMVIETHGEPTGELRGLNDAEIHAWTAGFDTGQAQSDTFFELPGQNPRTGGGLQDITTDINPNPNQITYHTNHYVSDVGEVRIADAANLHAAQGAGASPMPDGSIIPEGAGTIAQPVPPTTLTDAAGNPVLNPAGLPAGNSNVEVRYHSANPRAPEGTYSRTEPTVQVNTPSDRFGWRGNEDINVGGEPNRYLLPDGRWVTMGGGTSEADRAAAHWPVGRSGGAPEGSGGGGAPPPPAPPSGGGPEPLVPETGNSITEHGHSSPGEGLPPVNEETAVALESKPSLREALAENPEAANALTLCESVCIPPQATGEQVEKIQRLIDDYGLDPNSPALKEYFHSSEDLDGAIERLNEKLEALDEVKPGEDHLLDMGEEGLATHGVNEAGTSEAGVTRNPRHHVFPQEERPWFETHGFDPDEGFNIDDFTVELDTGTHQAIHGGGDWQLARRLKWEGEWNRAMMRELEQAEQKLGRKLTRDEIIAIGKQQMEKYDIDLPFVPYKEK